MDRLEHTTFGGLWKDFLVTINTIRLLGHMKIPI
jgi:hypothetical protein